MSCALPAAAIDHAPDRVLYIRAEFTDLGPYTTHTNWFNDLTAADAEAETFWTHNTYGYVDGFDSDITEVFNLGNKSAYINGSSTDIGGLAQAMRIAATNAGWDTASVDTFVYSFPDPADIGGGALGSPGNIWMPAFPYPPGLTHEYGHALALGHASLYEGGNAVYPGVHREGRDGLYMLGSEGGVTIVNGLRAPINLPMRDKMGAVPAGLVDYNVAGALIGQTVTETHRIFDFDRFDISDDQADGRKLGVTFQLDGKQWYVSFAPGLADHWAHENGSGWANGVAVHELTGDITRGLDFTPASQGGVGNEADYVDSRDGALTIGNTYTFPTANGSDLTLQPLATGFDGDGVKWIDVQITRITAGSTPDPGPQITLQNPDFAEDDWTNEEEFISNGGTSGNLSGWVAQGVVRGHNLDIDGEGDPTTDSGPQARQWNGWQTGDALLQVGFQNSGDPENAIYQDVSVFEEGSEYTFSIDLAPGFENANQDGFIQILRASDGVLLAETLFDADFSASSTNSTQSVVYTANAADVGSPIRIRFGADSGGTGTSVFANPLLLIALPADLDGDGDVDDADFGVAFAAFTGPNNGPSSNPDADLDGDGDVDDADFGIAFAAFTGPGTAANVPEPLSLALIVPLGLVLLRRQSRGRANH